MVDGTERKKLVTIKLLPIVFVVLIVVGVLLVSVVLTILNINAQKEAVENILGKASLQTSYEVENVIEQIYVILESSTKTSNLDELNLLERRIFLQTLLNSENNFDEVALFDSRGVELDRVSRFRSIDKSDFRKHDPSELYNQISENENYIGGLQLIEEYGELEPVFEIAVPITNLVGDFRGGIVATVNLNFIWEAVGNLEIEREGLVFIVNKNGEIVAYGSESEEFYMQDRDDEIVQMFMEAIGNGISQEELGVISTTNQKGDKVLTAFTPLEALDWAVIIEVLRSKAYQPIFIGIFIAILITFIAGGFGALAGGYLTTKFSRAILELNNVVTEINKTDKLDLKVPIEKMPVEELHNLGSVFNVMTSKLKASYEGLEEKVRIRTKELLASNKLKDLFMDIMRHDLLNPAGVVRTNSQLALMDEKDIKKKEPLEKIERNSNRMIRMIENASILAKLESGEKIDFKEEDFGVMLKGSVEELSERAKEKEMKIKVYAEGKFPAVVNPLIQNVFSNFISNAIKYSPEKTEIVAGIKKKNEDWLVYVEDRGEGIPAKYKKAIFERFTRLEKGAIKGSGLGLAISKKIAEAHNGKIWVRDHKGGGSVFYVLIPRVHEGIVKRPVVKPSLKKVVKKVVPVKKVVKKPIEKSSKDDSGEPKYFLKKRGDKK
jgi:signal transduction histidine kinase